MSQASRQCEVDHILGLKSQDLERAQVDVAVAAYVMCDKRAADPAHEDLTNTMMVLNIGQYIQASTLPMRESTAMLISTAYDQHAFLMLNGGCLCRRRPVTGELALPKHSHCT